MKVSTRALAMAGLLGAPWLFLGTFIEARYPHLSDSWFTGVWGVFFISGWMCSIIALRRRKITGDDKFGRLLLQVLLTCLFLANVSNVVQIIVEQRKPSYFFYIDLFWPLSNLVMLLVGIKVLVAGRLRGWERYIPLATGLWFPLAMLSSLMGNSTIVGILVGIYSAISWTLLAIVAMNEPQE